MTLYINNRKNQNTVNEWAALYRHPRGQRGRVAKNKTIVIRFIISRNIANTTQQSDLLQWSMSLSLSYSLPVFDGVFLDRPQRTHHLPDL